MSNMINSIKEFLYKNKHVIYLLIIPVYLSIFCIEEKLIVNNYYATYMPLDDLIPFCEWFVIPYFIWHPMMVLTGLYLFFRDVDGFKKYITFVGGGFLIIVILYAFFPNGQNLRPTTFDHSNILIDVVKLLYQSDTNTNVCPSLHVVGTIGAMIALLKCKNLQKLWFKILNVFVSILICLSTVFVKQHSIVDVFVGIAFGLVYYLIVYVLLPYISTSQRKQKLIASHSGSK